MTRNLRIIGSSFLLIILLASVPVYSQTATFSPYSRYGIGELIYKGYSWQRAMGGISIGTWSTSHLNFNNPATYAADTVTIFEVGANAEYVNIANSTTSQEKANGNVSYLSMGFPLLKTKWYLAMGLLPISASGYNIKQTTAINASGAPSIYYQGDGGYNRYYIGSGFKITPDLWAGVNASYIYGTTNITKRIEFEEEGYLNTRITNSITLGGFYAEGGLLYNKKLRNSHTLSIGLTYSPNMNVSARRSELWRNYFLTGTKREDPRDTVSYFTDEKGNVGFPMMVGTGFSFSKDDNWLIGFDAQYQQWEDLEVYGKNSGLNNTLRIATGMQWMPDAKSLKYFNRITYRLGGFYNSTKLTDVTQSLGGIYLIGDVFDKPALEVKTSDIDEAGLTFGFGLPLRGKPYSSDLDISFELSERGTIKNNLVRERYFKIFLGLTIREEWFRKTQFE